MLYYLIHLWFDMMKMHVFKCKLLEGNERAYKLYKEFGFKDAGLPKHLVRKNGVPARVITMTAKGRNIRLEA